MINPRLIFRNAARVLGYDLVRTSRQPIHKLLGLADRPIGTIFDVGANTGQFAAFIHPYFPKAKILSFDPLPASISKLSAGPLAATGIQECFQLALDDKIGAATFHVHDDHPYSSSLLATTPTLRNLFPETKSQHEISVERTTLDAWVAARSSPLSTDILLKIDVQGAEARVLQGAKTLLSTVSAVIAEVSFEPLYFGQSSFCEVVSLLDEAGLSYRGNLEQDCRDDGTLVSVDCVFTRDEVAHSDL